MKMNKKQQGFTLVELMITIGILAILAAITYPSYQEYVRAARLESARADVINTVKAAEKFYAVKHTFKDIGSTIKFAIKKDNTTNKEYLIQTESDRYRYEFPSAQLKDSNYMITAQPASDVYSDSTLNKHYVYLVYSSQNASYIRCTKGGFESITAASAPATSADCEPY